MNNADSPAMPLSGDAYTDFAGYNPDKNDSSYNPECQGLTKLEHFAATAIPPMELIIGLIGEHNGKITLNKYIDYAVAYKKKEAEALLKELEK